MLLLWRPHVEGGSFEFLFIKITAPGAGILLMLVAAGILLYGLSQVEPKSNSKPPPRGNTVAHAACFEKVFEPYGIHADRQKPIEAGADRAILLDEVRVTSSPIGLVLRNHGTILGGLMIAPDRAGLVFIVRDGQVFNSECAVLAAWKNASDGQRNRIRDGETLRFNFTGREFDLRLRYVLNKEIVASFLPVR